MINSIKSFWNKYLNGHNFLTIGTICCTVKGDGRKVEITTLYNNLEEIIGVNDSVRDVLIDVGMCDLFVVGDDINGGWIMVNRVNNKVYRIFIDSTNWDAIDEYKIADTFDEIFDMYYKKLR